MSRLFRVGRLVVATAVLLACDHAGPRTPAYVVIAPNQPKVSTGGTSQLRVTVVDADGRAIEGEPVAFQSSDVSVLTVSESGLLTSVGPLGTSIITAASGEVSAEVEATVVVGPSSLYVSPTLLELTVGQSAQLTVIVTDEAGDANPTDEVLFQTDNPEAAHVSSSGGVTAVGQGAATITVTSGELSREVLVAVSAP